MEGWRFSKKSETERVQGFKDLEKKGFKDSRIRGVERRKAEDRIQKSEVRSQEAGEG